MFNRNFVWPYLMIWGSQCSLQSLMQYVWIWPYGHWVRPITALPFLLLTFYFMLKHKEYIRSFSYLWLLLLAGMISGSLFILNGELATGSFILPVYNALMLSISYVIMGKWFGQSFIYLGLWLFTLTIITSLWYLGFAPLVLGLFGGLSLIACGYVLKRG